MTALTSQRKSGLLSRHTHKRMPSMYLDGNIQIHAQSPVKHKQIAAFGMLDAVNQEMSKIGVFCRCCNFRPAFPQTGFKHQGHEYVLPGHLSVHRRGLIWTSHLKAVKRFYRRHQNPFKTADLVGLL